MEEVLVSNDGKADEDSFEFDMIIGKIEEILVDVEFSNMVNRFVQENVKHFEDSEENKLIYTDIFKKYTNTIEQYLEKRLCKEIPEFSVEGFVSILETKKKEELEGEVFELLLSFTDFEAFKETMLSFKKGDEFKPLSSGLSV